MKIISDLTELNFKIHVLTFSYVIFFLGKNKKLKNVFRRILAQNFKHMSWKSIQILSKTFVRNFSAPLVLNQPVFFVRLHTCPAERFNILEPRNPSIHDIEQRKIRCLGDFWGSEIRG